jgi:hypothetical protein
MNRTREMPNSHCAMVAEVRDGGGGGLHISEAENAGDDGDDQKYESPFQHLGLLSVVATH